MKDSQHSYRSAVTFLNQISNANISLVEDSQILTGVDKLPNPWRRTHLSADTADKLPVQVFTNGRAVHKGGVSKADNIAYVLFVTDIDISAEMLSEAVYREAGCGVMSRPKITISDSAAYLEGSYVSKRVNHQTLTRYHIDRERRRISQTTITIVSRSYIDESLRDWLFDISPCDSPG
jgi:hypothetical protein